MPRIRWWLPVLLAAAIALVWWSASPSGDDPGAPPLDRSGLDAEGLPAAAHPELPPQEGAGRIDLTEESAPATVTPGPRVRVEMVWKESDTPAIGAAISAEIRRDRELQRLDAVADRDGLWEFSLEEEDSLLVLRTEGSPAIPPTVYHVAGHWPEPGPDGIHRIRLELPSAARVRGRVVDETGAPIPGAVVEASTEVQLSRRTEADRLRWRKPRGSSWEVLTDDQGRFEVPGLGRAFRLVPRAPGFRAIGFASAPLAAGDQVEEVELVLARTRTVHGRVVAPDGTPVEGAYVFASLADGGSNRGVVMSRVLGDGELEARSGPDGGFAFAELPRVPMVIEARHSGYWEAEDHLLAPEQTELELRLGGPELPLQIWGVVRAPDGTPVAGAEIDLDLPAHSITVHSGEDGGYSCRRASWPTDPSWPLGWECSALYWAEGYGVAEQSLPIDGPGEHRADLVLAPERVLRGRLVDPAGDPVVAGLELQSDRRLRNGWDWLFASDNHRHKSSPNGSFEIRGLWEDEFRLAVRVGGRLVALRELRPGPEEQLIRIDEEEAAAEVARFHFEVVDAETGAPVEQLYFGDFSGGSGGGAQRWREGGRIEFSHLPVEDLRFSFDSPGYAREILPAAAYGQGVHRFRIELRREAPLRLRFLRDGQPLAGVEASFLSPEGELLAYDHQSHNLKPLVSGRDGRIWLESLPAAPLRVEWRALGSAEVQVLELHPVPGRLDEREIEVGGR